MSVGWAVVLDGVVLSGGDDLDWVDLATSTCTALPSGVSGCLTLPPDGLGLPEIMVEDVRYAQRDGVRHFSDWYGPRIITLENVSVCPDGCPSCPSAREKAHEITQAWSRLCDDTELVIFTDCHGSEPPSGGTGPITGPYGVVGRPRVASKVWRQSTSKCAVMTLRFDAVDQRLYVLDECGTPGSGGECVTLTPEIEETFTCVDLSGNLCMPLCFESSSVSGTGPQTVHNRASQCACATITLTGQLTNPFVENLTTGERINYSGVISATDDPVVIDTCSGTATQGGAPRTHLISGDVTMQVQPGDNEIRLGSISSSDNGTAEFCFRPFEVSA